MSSFCVQYLAGNEDDVLLGAFFTHERSLAQAEQEAAAMAGEFCEAHAFRILDMGGGVHVFKVLEAAPEMPLTLRRATA